MYVGAVILQLGAGHRVDVAHRALVIGVVDPASPVDEVLAEGPDVLGLRGVDAEAIGATVDSLRARSGLPVAVEPLDRAGLRAALAAGAALVHDPTGGALAEDLSEVAGSGASVVLHPGGAPVEPGARRERLRRLVEAARAAGLPPERIVVDDALDRVDHDAGLELLRTTGQLAALGHAMASGPVGGQVAPGSDDAQRGEAIGVHVLAVMEGCRLLRTRDVRTARRAADLTVELLRHVAEAGGAAA